MIFYSKNRRITAVARLDIPVLTFVRNYDNNGGTWRLWSQNSQTPQLPSTFGSYVVHIGPTSHLWIHFYHSAASKHNHLCNKNDTDNPNTPSRGAPWNSHLSLASLPQPQDYVPAQRATPIILPTPCCNPPTRSNLTVQNRARTNKINILTATTSQQLHKLKPTQSTAGTALIIPSVLSPAGGDQTCPATRRYATILTSKTVDTSTVSNIDNHCLPPTHNSPFTLQTYVKHSLQSPYLRKHPNTGVSVQTTRLLSASSLTNSISENGKRHEEIQSLFKSAVVWLENTIFEISRLKEKYGLKYRTDSK